MLTHPDFKELLSVLDAHKVRYLVVGGYAVMKYSEPRFTKDLDLWISVDPENAHAVYAALRDFGAPLSGLTEESFSQKEFFNQMGVPPLRVDVMMSLPGMTFEEAWPRRDRDCGNRHPFYIKGRPDSDQASVGSSSRPDRREALGERHRVSTPPYQPLRDEGRPVSALQTSSSSP